MKGQKHLLAAGLAAGMTLLGTSCMTTYDAQGRPVQSVTPEGAAMGVAAAALIGYAAGKDRHDDRYRYHRGYGYSPYYGGGYRQNRYCR